MALKAVFDVMKKESGSILRDLDEYLIKIPSTDGDRAIDVNAPSQVCSCLRARYYTRLKYPRDSNPIEPRVRRIFDNGTHVHLRLQDYLLKQGRLLLDEVPILNEEYNIQGHADGLITISPIEVGVVEFKSIKMEDFKELKDAKDEHKHQGITYLFSLEQRRLELLEEYGGNIEAFEKCKKQRYKEYASHYQHLKSGNHYTREEKINFQCDLHDKTDRILLGVKKPISRIVFIYENKNDQNIKEYWVINNASTKVMLKEILNDYSYLNKCVRKKKLPDREGENRYCQTCRFCPYQIECWN